MGQTADTATLASTLSRSGSSSAEAGQVRVNLPMVTA